METKIRFYNIIAMVMMLFVGCSSSSNTSVDKPSTVINQFSTAMLSAGNQLQSSSLANAIVVSPIGLSTVNELCDENAVPLDNGMMMMDNDPEYPARVFYCKIARKTDSPESIPGAYGQTKSLACALENAGILFDGAEHAATLEVNTDCFTAEELADGEMPSSLEITYVASQPAAFNPHFQSGVVMTVPDFGKFSLAVKVEGTSIEFMGYENQGSTKTGVYVGQFDSSSGEIRFEGRHDRFNCTEDGSCGWSKHDRIYLQCGSVDAQGKCVDIETIHAASSDISNNGYGRIATISGDFATGVKSRFYGISGGQFNTTANWTNVPNALCYDGSSNTGGDCSSNEGIKIPSSATFKFPLFDGHQTSLEFSSNIADLTFTSVSMSSDLP